MFQIRRTGFTIFGADIRWYGVLIALGALLGVLLALRREKRLGLPKDTALDLALLGIPAAIVCARLYFVAFSWDYYGAHPEKILSIHEGGMAIYGGLLGGLLAGFCYSRAKKLPYLKLADLAAPSFAVGQCVGRWGNFLNQEAYGAAVTDPAWQFFPAAVFIPEDGLWHFATFFYESLWCLLIVLILLRMERRGRFRRTGDVFWWYCLLYAAERFVVEGLRADSLYLGRLRVSQALSLAVLAGVAILFVLRARGLPPALRISGIIIPFALALFLLMGILEASTGACLGIAAGLTVLCAGCYALNPRSETIN